MRLSSSKPSRGIDWITLSIYLSLVVIGWLMLYATNYQANNENIFELNSAIGKQSIWVIISLIVFVFMLIIDWKFWATLSYPIYALAILLLIAVLIFGTEIKGAKSWFSFGAFSFQPSEFAKLACALAMAAFLGYFKTSLKESRYIFIAIALIFFPAALIVLQPDVGSALIFSSFFLLLFRKGLSPSYYVVVIAFALSFVLSLALNPILFSAGLLLLALIIFVSQMDSKLIWWIAFFAIATSYILLFVEGLVLESNILLISLLMIFSLVLWKKRKQQIVVVVLPFFALLTLFSFGTQYAFDNFLKPHQQDRINVWLNPSNSDPRGSLYNLMQSKLAISSGGLKGKGFLEGTMTKLNYVPEQSTDFIFSTIGEEQGFIGAAGVIILFTILLIRITIIAERSRHKYITNYAYGVAGILFAHYFINIGMTMGLMPVIGIPLPFISKGGSSLLIFSIMIGILLKMDLSRYRGA